MGKFDGMLICSDCDGTLTNSQGKISKENAQAIKYFQEEGGYFTVATGRYPTYFKRHSNEVIANAPVVCCNGIALYDLEKNQVVDQVNIDSDYKDVEEYILSELKAVKELRLGDLYSDFKDTTYEKYGDTNVYRSGEDIVRAIIVQDISAIQENYEKLNAKFSDKYAVVIAWSVGIEILPKNCSKAAMLPSLKRYLKNITKVYSIGDYDNDIDLFKNVDVGYAVENAPERVKAHAHKLAPHHDNNAIAFVINEIEENL